MRKLFFGTKQRSLYTFLGLFCAVIYTPYLVKGGLIYDDWAVAKLSRDCQGLTHSISCFWPGYPDRPLAALYYSVMSNLFRGWAGGYIFVTVAAWISGVSLLFYIFKQRIGVRFATTFFIFAVVPSVSTTVIFSPAMQGVGAIAFLMWSLSFFLLNKYIDMPIKSGFILGYVFMLASLALYESSLPLFALSVLWPLYVLKPSRNKAAFLRDYAKKYLLPVVIVLLILVCYQHFYVQQYYDYISKVRFSSMNGHVFDFVLRVLFNTGYVFVVSTSMLVLAVFMRLRSLGWEFLLGAVVCVWFVGRVLAVGRVTGAAKKIKHNNSAVLFAAVLVILLGVSLLHFVAVSPPTSVGYNNRGVVGISVALSLFMATLWNSYLGRKKYVTAIFVLFAAGYILSFVVQRNNYIAGARIQSDIKSQVIPQVNKANQDAMVVLAEVPTYTNKNFNNETIFSDEVLDWGNFLRVHSNVKSIRGISLSPGRVKRGEVKVVDGKLRIMTYPEDVPLNMVWYFDIQNMNLQKVADEEELARIIENAEIQPLHDYPAPVDARVRNDIRNWLASY